METMPGIISQRITEQAGIAMDEGVRSQNDAGKGNAHQQTQQQDQARRAKRAVHLVRVIHFVHAVHVVHSAAAKATPAIMFTKTGLFTSP